MQLLYYEHYGKLPNYIVNWFDDPEDWSQKTSGNKKICIEISSKEEASISLLYKITVFINTGLIQVQGIRRDLFTINDFPVLTQLLSKILEINKTHEKTSDKSETNKMKENIVHDTNVKEILVENTKVDQCNNIIEAPTTESNSIVELYKPDKYLENIQTHFTSALEKICSEQSKLFDAKLRIMEDNYTKLLENNFQKFDKILDTVSKASKTAPEADSKNISRINTLEKENITMKNSIQEVRHDLILNEEVWKSKIETQKTKFDLQKQMYEKTIKDMQKDIERLQNDISSKDKQIQHDQSSLGEAHKIIEQKDNEIMSLKSTRNADDTNAFTVLQNNPKSTNSNKHVVLIGTSNIEGIDTSKISSKFNTEKILAYTLDQTEKAIEGIHHTPDVLVLHSLTNDLKHRDNEECVNHMCKIVQQIEQKFSNTEIIISLPTPRADSDLLNNKGQMLSLMIKDKLIENQNIHFCDNSNMSYKGKPIPKFLDTKDNYHLSNSGIRMLAANIRDCIDETLGFPHRSTNDRNNNYQNTTNRRENDNFANYSTTLYRDNYRYENYRGRGQQRGYSGRGLTFRRYKRY